MGPAAESEAREARLERPIFLQGPYKLTYKFSIIERRSRRSLHEWVYTNAVKDEESKLSPVNHVPQSLANAKMFGRDIFTAQPA